MMIVCVVVLEYQSRGRDAWTAGSKNSCRECRGCLYISCARRSEEGEARKKYQVAIVQPDAGLKTYGSSLCSIE